MNLTWRTYPGDRQATTHPKGFTVIKPAHPIQSMPVFCPICEAIMLTSYDEDAYNKFGCCDGCASVWAYPRREEWLSGWRPTREEVETRRRTNLILG